MTDAVLLDAGPLGMISHPRAGGDIVEWLATLVAAGVEVLIPEVADYEVRRELLRSGRGRGIERLDLLKVRNLCTDMQGELHVILRRPPPCGSSRDRRPVG